MALFGSMAAFAADIKEINQNNFNEEVSSGIVLVDFYGKWCGPCKRLGPTLEKVANSMSGRAKIVKVDIDKSRNLAQSYQVEGVPTMILFKNGKEVDRLVGYYDQGAIEKFIKTH